VPLLPIDLQTLFSQTAQVGKEQAVQKEQVHNAQVVQGTQIARQSDARDKKVNQTEKQEEGAEQVRRRKRREEGKERNLPKKGKGKSPASQKRSVFRDPNLGSRIDISG
jgi:hypothetical protein